MTVEHSTSSINLVPLGASVSTDKISSFLKESVSKVGSVQSSALMCP